MSCKTCKYFKETNGVYGECRRYPPRPSLHGNAIYPVLLCNADSCGEFKADPKEKTQTTVKTTRNTK
jgi:hypothetical protein